jgi:hypothetical protein
VNNHPPYRPSDAEVVAGWAAEALRDGRYNLGQALAKIAMQAETHEDRIRKPNAVPVPFLGPTRDEMPRDPRTMGQPTVINGTGPTGNADRDLAAEEAAIGRQLEQQQHPGATIIMKRPESLADVTVPSAPSSARCREIVVRDGVRDECHAVAYWSNDHNRWVHVDMTIDAHHEPVVPV